MSWKDTANRRLLRATGFELRRGEQAPAAAASRAPGKKGTTRPSRKRSDRALPGEPPPAPGDRLVERPTFVLSSIRSGSTLLRVLLNSHSQIHSPQELHFRYTDVQLTKPWARNAMSEIGLDERRLEYLLWDRVLHRQLTASGKPTIVCKTPNDVFIADRIRVAWPDARFIFLLRHPAAVLRSRKAIRPQVDDTANARLIASYCEAVEAARQRFDGHTVRYEDVTADPARETQALCAFLGLEWEPGMVEYGAHDHGRHRPGLGDWADKIKTGRVQAAAPPPEEVHPLLRDVAASWGYLPQREPARQPA